MGSSNISCRTYDIWIKINSYDGNWINIISNITRNNIVLDILGSNKTINER